MVNTKKIFISDSLSTDVPGAASCKSDRNLKVVGKTPDATPEFDHHIAANEYGFYCIPKDYAAREVPTLLRQGKVYEPDTLKFMARHIGTGDIVTGGAFVGDFFPAMCQALQSHAQLHSFEPNPKSYAAAQHTIQLNNLTNAVLSPVAVGETSGILPLQISRGSGSQAMAARAKIVDDAQGENTIDVTVTTLDDLVPDNRKVSILQLDIEGFELQAILGARRMIANSKPIIILEAARPRIQRLYLRTLRNHFPELNYRAAGVIERNAIFIPTNR